LGLLCGAFAPTGAVAQSIPVIDWKNGAAQAAVTQLNGATHLFTTTFRGVNDVTINELSGSVTSIWADTFTASPGNNPSYLTSFIGTTGTNTGNGTAGQMNLLETSSSPSIANQLQFDFAIPLDSNSRIVVADVDSNERYTFQAYHFNGSSYVALSLSGWAAQNFTGQTGITPNGTWPTWTLDVPTTTGTLTGSSGAMNEPVVVLTPSQTVDRLVFTRPGEAGGSAEIQIMQVPEPSGFMLMCSTAAVWSCFSRRRAGTPR
jgi:hypothetical protein